MRSAISVALVLSPTFAVAGGEPYQYPPPPYYREAPPVTVYAEMPPPPGYVISNAVGGIVAGALSLPFRILGTIFGPPQVPLVQDGMVPVTNSRYDPVTGQFLPPGYLPAPYPPPPEAAGPTYAPVDPYLPPRTSRPSAEHRSGFGGCYGQDGSFIGGNNPECEN